MSLILQLRQVSSGAAVRWCWPALALLLCTVAGAGLQAQRRVTFLGVALDTTTRDADRRLTDYLTRSADLQFAQEELEYERMIRRLVNWRSYDGVFVARTTPYVYVVAEMLGAEVEPLATYVSAATRRTTYHSYFVVRRRDFPSPPALMDLVRFIRDRPMPPRFVYHSQFSTSSYFLPLLLFRSSNIFHMPESTESLAAIRSTRAADAGSSTLIDLVARGEADIAAVWDDTRSRYEAERNPASREVHFVQLPTAIPNDLLVCSSGLDPERKAKLAASIRMMAPDEIGVGDFQTWRSMTDAPDARLALANLRWLARERQAPATVEVASPAGPAQAGLFEAARQAVRLSGREFTLFDADFHEHIDFRWALEPVHDGSVTLVSSIPGADVEPQTFRLSFRDVDDLTHRVVSVVQSRMHRIRYVWAFSGGTPIVIRDIAFALRPGTHVKVQPVTWIDPERNRFRAGPLFNAAVRDTSFYRYELDVGDFVRFGGGQPSLDPMSNSGYRVILMRPEEERLLFRALAAALVAAFLLAGVAAVVEIVRFPPRRGARALRAERT